MNNQSLPANLQSIIETENVVFSLIAKRKYPVKKTKTMIITGIAILAFMSIFVYAFLGPVFMGGEVHFKTNGVPTTASWDNFQPLIFPTLVIGLFVLIGISALSSGVNSYLQTGGYFIGTANRLIHYSNGIIKTYDWEQFSGNIEINDRHGDLSLELRTGRVTRRSDRADEFVPDVIDISGITNVLEVAEICSKRIKENDPTPENKA